MTIKNRNIVNVLNGFKYTYTSVEDNCALIPFMGYDVSIEPVHDGYIVKAVANDLDYDKTYDKNRRDILREHTMREWFVKGMNPMYDELIRHDFVNLIDGVSYRNN